MREGSLQECAIGIRQCSHDALAASLVYSSVDAAKEDFDDRIRIETTAEIWCRVDDVSTMVFGLQFIIQGAQILGGRSMAAYLDKLDADLSTQGG